MKRYYFKGALVLLEPLHIGFGEEEEFVDNPIMRDELGNPVLPGTSLTGVMSSILERIIRLNGYDEDIKNLLFGSGDRDAVESCLLVYDCPLTTSKESFIEDHNAVSRFKGSAEEKHLFHIEVIPSKSFFKFMCEFRERFRSDADNKKALAILLEVLELMEHGWAWLGGRSSTGHGRFRLEGICCKMMDMTNPEHILLFTKNNLEDIFDALPRLEIFELMKKSVSLPFKTIHKDDSFSPEVVVIEGILRPIEPFLVKTGLSLEAVQLKGAYFRKEEIGEALKACKIKKEESITVDSAFCREHSVAYLPGSSIRGVLRSHAEKIVRTLVYKKIISNSLPTDVAEEIACESAWILKDLREKGKELQDKSFEDIYNQACLISKVFGFTAMGGRIRISNAYPINPIAFEQGLKLMDHVAIDRFTGGAAEGKKFNARPFFPSNPLDDKGDMRFYICLEDFERWHFGLVALLLKDLMNGRIAIGYGKNKGFGKVMFIPETMRIRVLTSETGSLKDYLKEKNNSIGGVIEGEIEVVVGKNFWISNNCSFYSFVIDSIKEFRQKMIEWVEIRKRNNGKDKT